MSASRPRLQQWGGERATPPQPLLLSRLLLLLRPLSLTFEGRSYRWHTARRRCVRTAAAVGPRSRRRCSQLRPPQWPGSGAAPTAARRSTRSGRACHSRVAPASPRSTMRGKEATTTTSSTHLPGGGLHTSAVIRMKSGWSALWLHVISSLLQECTRMPWAAAHKDQ